MLYLGIAGNGGIELMAPQRLLVVEDDPGVRTTIVTCLELEGYAVDSASSTKEAIDRLAAASYPVVDVNVGDNDRIRSRGQPVDRFFGRRSRVHGIAFEFQTGHDRGADARIVLHH